MKILIYLILIAIFLFFINKFLSIFKFPKMTSLAVFTGGLKVGKSGVSLAKARFEYIRAVVGWWFDCRIVDFLNLFHRKDNKISYNEKPLFYSTIPLRYIKYVPVTREHLLRKKRFAYKSVIYIDEASLVCDSQLIQDKKVNSELLLFFKLFGHSTHGGKCVVNTHCLTDLHYALKRCTSQYFYIHSTSRYIPFFTICNMREERYSEDGSTVNVYGQDVEDTQKKVILLSSIFKKYDRFCYSYLTDHLPTDTVEDCVYKGKHDSLKAEEIVSFRKEFYEQLTKLDIENLHKEILENEKENS